MSSYTFFVQTYQGGTQEETPGCFCPLLSVLEEVLRKGKFENMAKADKAHYEREMKTYTSPSDPCKGDTKKKSKDISAP